MSREEPADADDRAGVRRDAREVARAPRAHGPQHAERCRPRRPRGRPPRPRLLERTRRPDLRPQPPGDRGGDRRAGEARSPLQRLASQAPVRDSLRWIVGTAAAAIVAAALTGAFVAGRYEGALGQMARELAATRQRLQREVALYRNAADLLRDPTTQVVTLRGLGPSAGATGRMIWHPAAGGQLVVANLPPAPPGKAYELWTIGEGAPRPAGVFRVDALGRATHRAEPVAGGVRVFAVTLEPERGVPAPTGPTVLASAK